MILGQVSSLDCIVFLLFLAPQLLWHVGFFSTLWCGIRALPFLTLKLPLSIIYERLLLTQENRSPFVKQASWFEDIVIRCVRYAFAYIPAKIGRVFFSKMVALPFLRFRMMRHGYFRSPIHWEGIKQKDFKGIWIISDPTRKPDIVIYYAHGGGFSMGSSYFYLEFLLAFNSLLKSSTKFENPAILALEYTLVPDSSYPTQLHQAISGYKYLLSITYDPSLIVFSGDSAGATIILSLLLHIGNPSPSPPNPKSKSLPNSNPPPTPKTKTKTKPLIESGIQGVLPSLAILISPWTTLLSPTHHNTRSDYLDARNLHHYARQYISDAIAIDDPLVSPGNCVDVEWWKMAAPTKGFFISYGAEEVFAPEIRDLVRVLRDAGVGVDYQEAEAGIHAWPVASLFLCATREKRLGGLKTMVKQISEHMGGRDGK